MHFVAFLFLPTKVPLSLFHTSSVPVSLSSIQYPFLSLTSQADTLRQVQVTVNRPTRLSLIIYIWISLLITSHPRN